MKPLQNCWKLLIGVAAMDKIRDSFVFYGSAWDSVEALRQMGREEDAGQLLEAIVSYGFYGTYDRTNPIVVSSMQSISCNMDRAAQRYTAAKEGGKKGGAKKQFPDEIIWKLLGEGKTNKEIAIELGCSEKTVSRAKARQMDMSSNVLEKQDFSF